MHSRCKSKSLWHLLLGGSSLLFWQGDSISKLMFSFKELIPPASRPLPFVTREYYPPLYTSPSYHMLTQFISSAGCARAAPRLMGSVPCALHLPIPLLMTQTAPSAPDVPCPAFTYSCSSSATCSLSKALFTIFLSLFLLFFHVFPPNPSFPSFN